MPTFHRGGLPILALIAATWLVYAPASQAHFLGWDDPDMVFQNPLLNPPTWSGAAEFWRRPFLKLYTPLPYTAWSGLAAMEHQPAGDLLRAGPFHVLNLLLHTAAVILAFGLLCELTDRIWAAWAGAMLFALHPLQVEPVAWVAGMNNLMFGCLAIAALWQYVSYAKRGGNWRLALATMLYAASLLSKPTAVVVPLVAAILDLGLLKRPPRVCAGPLVLWLAMAAPIAIVAHSSQPPTHFQQTPVLERLWEAVDAIGFYAVKLIVPTNLTMDYERTPRWLMQHVAAAWRGVVVAALAAAICLTRATRWMRAPLAICVVALLPVLGLVPFDFQDYSTVADRYMYFPMLGVALLVAGLMARARGPVPWTIALTALLLLGLRSSDQLAVWHDTPAIIARQLDFDPDSSTGHKIYASWLMASNRYDDAEQEFRIAIAALQREGKRGDGAVWYDYGNMLWREGRVSDAIEMYRQAIAHMPPEKVAMACNNLGLAYLVDGDPQAARQQFLNALAAQPDYADARRNLDRLDAVNR